MKDNFLRLVLILLILIVESVVGLPILGFSLFLGWYKKSFSLFLIWFSTISLSISMLWGVSWWFVATILLVITYAHDQLSNHVLNKLVRITLLVLPAVLVLALNLNLDFSWRIIIYGLISLLITFIFQKNILTNYENKYL